MNKNKVHVTAMWGLQRQKQKFLVEITRRVYNK